MNLTETLNIIIESLGYILPEICLAVGAVIILVIELIKPNQHRKFKTTLHLLILLVTAFLVTSTAQKTPFNGIIVVDGLSTFFKYLFLIAVGTALLFPKNKEENRSKGEYHFLLITLLLGGFFVLQSTNLLVFYLSLELISIASYILTTFSFDKKGYEAGIKYLLFGALSSGIMLYGISLLYGLSGSLEIELVMQAVFVNPTMLVWLSLLFFSVGLLFKISLVPMHIWAPDVYEAAPTPVVTVFSIVPKLAALVFLYRLSEFVPIENIEWVKLLSLIAVVSMFIGNLSALWQNNAKRMLAYSSIAHAGFLLIGIIVHTDSGLQGLLFYAVVYGLMNIATFYFINLMEKNGLSNIQDYAGLGKKIPLLGVLILIVMISLTGLPPTGGFTAKLLVFTALWDYYSSSPNELVFWLFALGLGNSIIALIYYLKVPYFMFFKTAVEPNEFEFSLFDKTFLSVLVFLILLLFFKADWLISIINNSNFVFS